MARHKNADWNIPEKPADWHQVQAAVLMDIRDELQKLNSMLSCPNFMGMPHVLKRIDKRLAKKISLKR